MSNDHPQPDEVREIHALTPPQPASQRSQGMSWSSRSSSASLSVSSEVEDFTTMSREFNALVVAGTTMQGDPGTPNLGRIGEDEPIEETNPLAIVADINPIASPRRNSNSNSNSNSTMGASSSNDHNIISVEEEVSLHRVKKEEVASKIVAWETAEIAKINNKFKREEVILKGLESEETEKATALFKKAEACIVYILSMKYIMDFLILNNFGCYLQRRLEEKRAKAVEKMQNEVAKAHRKAEEKRASAEAKRGTKVAKIKEMSNLLRAVGRTPSKRSFF